MQYANVIINHKAGFEPLTYSIPPSILPYLERGSVVMIPFGNQIVHGVVTDFVRHVSHTLAPKLKPMTAVIYPYNAIDGAKIDAARWLSEGWGLSQGQTLFDNLPEFGKKRQSIGTQTVKGASKYKVIQYQIGLKNRANWYYRIFMRLLRSQNSGLIVTSSHSYSEKLFDSLTRLGCRCRLYPQNPTPKTRRDFWLGTRQTTDSTLYIGTRGALVSDFTTLGIVIIDEPWLPGHKDDNSPKMWSIFTANALAKAKNIPLLLVSSLLWPENRLLPISRTHRQSVDLGDISLTPKRSLTEQITHWKAETDGLSRIIIVHESTFEKLWCGQCQKTVTHGVVCPNCGSTPVILPRISVESTRSYLQDTSVPVIPMAAYLGVTADAILVLNFDANLSITDWRTSMYLGTIIRHYQESAKQTFLATAYPDIWTKLIAQLGHRFDEDELQSRYRHGLPPASLLIRLTAPQSEILEKLIRVQPSSFKKIGPIRHSPAGYQLTIVLEPQAKIPTN